MKSFILIVMAVCMLLATVMAAPPFQSSTQTTGLELSFPTLDYVKQYENLTLSFHVFNSTSGFMMNSTQVSCLLHLYGKDAVQHLYKTNLITYDNIDFETNISGANFSQVGVYSYIVECNSTNVGGFVKVPLVVTYTGNENISGVSFTFFIVAFLFILGVFIYQFVVSTGRILKQEFDIIDLAANFGVYFVLVAFYIIQTLYLNLPLVNSILLVFISIGAFSHVIISLIFFMLIMIWNSLEKNRQSSGVSK